MGNLIDSSRLLDKANFSRNPILKKNSWAALESLVEFSLVRCAVVNVSFLDNLKLMDCNLKAF